MAVDENDVLEKITVKDMLDMIVTAGEIMDMFPGMSDQTVRQACRRGVLISRRTGKNWLVYKPSAQEYFSQPNKSGRPQWQGKR